MELGWCATHRVVRPPAPDHDDRLEAHKHFRTVCASDATCRIQREALLRQALVRVHQWSDVVADPRVNRALFETCFLLLLVPDAVRVAEERNVSHKIGIAEMRGGGVNLCYAPPLVVFDGLVACIPDSAWRFVACRPVDDDVHHTVVAPHTVFTLHHSTLRGRIAVLVLRAPDKLLTLVDHNLCLGVCEESCNVFVGRSVAALEGAIDVATRDIGGTSLWILCENDKRQRRLVGDRSHVEVPHGGAVHVQRRRFRWHVGVTHGTK